MAPAPCAKHSKVLTYVRCGRCERPICVDCMVDTPVGKKCRDCGRPGAVGPEADPALVVRAFMAALLVAVPAGLVMHQVGLLLLAFPYGFLVAEVALRASKRSRGGAAQAVVGLAAVIGGVVGAGLQIVPVPGRGGIQFDWLQCLDVYRLVLNGLGVAVAVSRIRFI